MDPYQATDTFRADSSFRLTAPWAPKATKGPVIPGLFADPHITSFNGRYYLFNIASPGSRWARTVIVHRADAITGPDDDFPVARDVADRKAAEVFDPRRAGLGVKP